MDGRNQNPKCYSWQHEGWNIEIWGCGGSTLCVLQGLNILSIYCLALWCFHIFWSPNSVVEASLCMLLILFQPAQNIAFSQVNASGLSSVPIFLFPNSQLIILIPGCRKHRVFTGKCNLCVSRPSFSYSLILNLFQAAENIVFSQVKAACVSRPIFSYSLIHNLFPNAQNIVFSQVNAACVSRPIFSYSLTHD